MQWKNIINRFCDLWGFFWCFVLFGLGVVFFFNVMLPKLLSECQCNKAVFSY